MFGKFLCGTEVSVWFIFVVHIVDNVLNFIIFWMQVFMLGMIKSFTSLEEEAKKWEQGQYLIIFW